VIIDKLFSNRTGYTYINYDKPMAGILASSIAAKNNKPVKLELDSFIEDNFAKYSKENSDNYIIG
ncbi:MAG: cell wall-binding repeat-containing protein, partial [Peptostreptococcus anaerobius]